MRTIKDELLIWAAMIAGAVIKKHELLSEDAVRRRATDAVRRRATNAVRRRATDGANGVLQERR